MSKESDSNYLRPRFRTDSTQLLKNHLGRGHLTVLVSSSPQPILQQIGKELGVAHVVGTDLATRAGRYTGGLAGPVCIDEYKASMTKAYLGRLGINVDYASSYAYADSTPDLALLEMVGNPVATHADAGLAWVAAARGWRTFPELYSPA